MTTITELHEVITNAVRHEITERIGAGSLGICSSAPDYGFHMAQQWNALATGSDLDWHLDHISSRIAQVLISQARMDFIRRGEMDRHKRRDPADILPLVKAGTTSKYPGPETRVTSSVTDGNFHFRIEGWELSFFEVDASGDAVDLIPLPFSPLVRDSIVFPTGELIIADWFRIEEFSEHVSKGREHSLNNAIGRVAHSLESRTLFNMIEVPVGNSSPSIFRAERPSDTDDILIGHHYGEKDDRDGSCADNGTAAPAGLEEIGYVCTDYWAASIIDRADLLRVLKHAGCEDAGEKINRWLESSDQAENITRVRVAPGEWSLTWCDDRDDDNMPSCLEDAGIAGPRGLSTLLRLSRKPIPAPEGLDYTDHMKMAALLARA